MIHIIGALTPVFAVILLGYLFKKWRFVPDGFWSAAERITFYVFFPSLLVATTAKADMAGLQVLPMVGTLIVGIVLVVALTFWLRFPLRLDGPSFTSLIQGSVRPNVYVGLAAALALFGTEGLTLISLSIAAAVPTVNAISVVAMVRYASLAGTPVGWKSMLWPIAKNPMILACATGLVLNGAGVGLPPLIGPLLEILGRASLPVGLLAVGAGLELAAMRSAGRTVAVTSAIKILLLPVVTHILCLSFGLDGLTATVPVLYASLPGSASAYVMARQMGGNTVIMAGSITLTTIAAAVTMPLILIAVG